MKKKYKANITRTLNKSKQAHIDYGMEWYEQAREYCQGIAIRYKLPLYAVVGALAALSPRNKWERNKSDLVAVIEHGENATTATFNRMKDKAIMCLNATSEQEAVKILNGKKITNFFLNIYHEECNFVTVDVWAMRVVGLKKSLTNKVYDEITQAFREVAEVYDIMPKQLQAITWGVVRNGYQIRL